MNTAPKPLVSVLTPVYNGAEYLVECIESVLAQTYSNWDYTIVDNCSSDGSLAIAQKYAAVDSRIRVMRNDRYLPIVQNHNHTIRQISPESKYCKFVFADDWLYPACIEEMVHVAEQSPEVGVVGGYTMDGSAVRWHGPPYPGHHIPGREVCRRQLMGGPYVFGTMTSLLLRSSQVRKRPAFFNERNLQADVEACFDILQESDFGFVHQVLSCSREREHTTDSFAANLNSHRLAEFVLFLKYGPVFLEEAEYRQRWTTERSRYYRVLAHNVLRLRPKQFWQYHVDALAAVGQRIHRGSLAASVLAELVSQLIHPLDALKHGSRWWSAIRRHADGEKLEEYRRSVASNR